MDTSIDGHQGHEFSEILDVSALKRECDFLFKEDNKHTTDIRPTFRCSSARLARKAGKGQRTAESRWQRHYCAWHISWLQDRLIEILHALACEYVYSKDTPLQIAVSAVGGYGRGTLTPESDIDILILAIG